MSGGRARGAASRSRTRFPIPDTAGAGYAADMPRRILSLLALVPAMALAQVTVTPPQGSPAGGEWPVAFRGGPQLVRLGVSRVGFGSPPRELVFLPTSDGKGRLVVARGETGDTPVARIPSPGGGEPRVYLSDRDDLAAFTVDFGTWDTCPEVRALRPGGAEVIPLPCAEAGRAGLAALQAAGHVPPGEDARTRMQFRLANLRYVEPGFLAAGGVELDAELGLHATGEERRVLRARFLLRDGRLQGCRLLD